VLGLRRRLSGFEIEEGEARSLRRGAIVSEQAIKALAVLREQAQKQVDYHAVHQQGDIGVGLYFVAQQVVACCESAIAALRAEALVAALTAAREALDATRENCEDFDIQPCWCPEDWPHIGHCPYCVKNCKALAAIDAVLTPRAQRA